MKNFLYNYEDDELFFLVNLLDSNILYFEEKAEFLRDFKDEITTYLSNNKEV